MWGKSEIDDLKWVKKTQLNGLVREALKEATFTSTCHRIPATRPSNSCQQTLSSLSDLRIQSDKVGISVSTYWDPTQRLHPNSLRQRISPKSHPAWNRVSYKRKWDIGHALYALQRVRLNIAIPLFHFSVQSHPRKYLCIQRMWKLSQETWKSLRIISKILLSSFHRLTLQTRLRDSSQIPRNRDF